MAKSELLKYLPRCRVDFLWMAQPFLSAFLGGDCGPGLSEYESMVLVIDPPNASTQPILVAGSETTRQWTNPTVSRIVIEYLIIFTHS